MRFYSAAEVEGIINALSGGLTLRPPCIEVGDLQFRPPENTADFLRMLDNYPKWLRNDLTLAGGVMAACLAPHGRPEATAYNANKAACAFILEHPQIPLSTMYQALACLLGLREAKPQEEPDNETILKLQIALSQR